MLQVKEEEQEMGKEEEMEVGRGLVRGELAKLHGVEKEEMEKEEAGEEAKVCEEMVGGGNVRRRRPGVIFGSSERIVLQIL